MQHRWFIELLGVRVVVVTIALFVPSRFAYSQIDTEIDELIQSLGSPESKVRDESAVALRAIGEPARFALRWATRDPAPEIAHRAWVLLGRLPFYLPEDPPDVKACLFDYESDNEDGKARRIDRLGGVQSTSARRALVRITRDEPVRRLRWRAVAPFVGCDDEQTLAEIREARVSQYDPAQVVLAAIAWRKANPDRAAILLQRAMEMDAGLGPYIPEMTVQVVPLLKSMGMGDEARAAFEAGYRTLLDDLFALPADALRMNRLASYCLRCDEHLTQALDLATRAVTAEPNNPNFLATLAEVHFQMGRAEEAVRLETRALRLRPDDPTIERRLERYLAAVE